MVNYKNDCPTQNARQSLNLELNIKNLIFVLSYIFKVFISITYLNLALPVVNFS